MTQSPSGAQIDPMWQEWLDFLHDAPEADRVQPLLQAFRSRLEERMPPEEIDRALATVIRLMRTRLEGWPILFDRIYSNPSPGFRTAPNALLVWAVDDMEPGSALDLCMGQGRNALYLAGRGWQTTGVDVSAVGVDVAAAQARLDGVEIDAVCASHEEFDFGTDRLDLIVLTYAPVKLTEPGEVSRIREALRSGGRVVIESFASPRDSSLRTPVDIDPDDLREAYAGFAVLRFETVEEVPDWDDTPKQVVRMVAAKA
jgi:hypothetical protein